MSKKASTVRSKREPSVKILIACHKPSELPKSDLFLPVRVGAALAKDDFGLQRDDDGDDNISDKNPSYCELTAIYWAWKNLDADYYGLFHYRRFYSFSNKTFPVSDDGHMMVRAGALSPEVFCQYGLTDNDNNMRQIIAGHDLIVHQSRPVRGIPTPIGVPSSSVYEHYKFHDCTIIKLSDLDDMLRIIDEKYSDIAPTFHDYMNGDKFLGYNMFIMRKELFNGMCDFTFGVLSEMEKIIGSDLPNRSKNANRIYGYLAEILTSGYIYYLRQSQPSLRVDERQMIYALQTDPVKELDAHKDTINIAFDLTRGDSDEGVLALPTIKSFLDNLNNRSKYHIIVVHNGDIMEAVKSEIADVGHNHDNVVVDYINFSVYKAIQKTLGVKKCPAFKLCAPYMEELNNIDKLLVINWNAWCNGSIDELYNTDLGNNVLAASYDIAELGDLLEVSVEKKTAHQKQLLNKYSLEIDDMFDDTVVLCDLKEMRQAYPSISDIRIKLSDVAELKINEQIDYLFKGKIKALSQKWNYRIPNDAGVNYKGQFFAPIGYYDEWQQLANDYVIGQIYPSAIINVDNHEVVRKFYKELQYSGVWPLYVAKRLNKLPKPVPIKGLKDRLAPIGSRRRELAKKVLPKGSRRRTALSKAWHRLRG